jgi:hypothetical protein
MLQHCSDSNLRSFRLLRIPARRDTLYTLLFLSAGPRPESHAHKCGEETYVCRVPCAMSKTSDNPLILVPSLLPDKPEMERGPERRGTARYPFTATAEIMELRSNTRVTGRSSDLGLGGCYIDILSPFALGSLVRVRLEREKKVFEAMATVSYAQQSFGMGLAFTEVKPEHETVLHSWIAELNGEALPEFNASVAEPDSGEISAVLHLQQVLNELINLMVRKNVINAVEATALLRKIFH